MQFTKMHGAGNDFVVLDLISAGKSAVDRDWGELAQAACDRHFGIGADGILLMLPSDQADVRMRIFNLDGSEAQINQKKSFLNSELAAKQQELQDLVGGPRAKNADDALDSALEADAKREADVTAARKAKEEAARSDEARKLAAAENAKIAEENARKKEMVAGGRAAAPGEAGDTLFEERWADVLMRVRVELQKYKRW